MKTLIVTEYLTASAIQAGGARFLRAEAPTEKRGKCALIFDDENGEASRLLAAHQQGTLQLPTRVFVAAIQMVKDTIFQARG